MRARALRRGRKPAWLSAFVLVCPRVPPLLDYAGGLEVPSSNLGAPTEKALETGPFLLVGFLHFVSYAQLCEIRARFAARAGRSPPNRTGRAAWNTAPARTSPRASRHPASVMRRKDSADTHAQVSEKGGLTSEDGAPG